MKFFLILMLVGYASANLFEALDKESYNAVNEFSNGIQAATPLHVALGLEDSEELRRFERDLKEELKEHVKKAFDDAMKKVTDAVKNGFEVNNDALEILKDLHEKMKDLHITDDEVKDGIEHLKDKVNSHLRNILEKMGIFGKRSTEAQPLESVIGDLNLRNLFLKLKQMILEKMDVSSVKQSIAKVLGQGTQRLCEWLTNKGKQKVLNFFDRVLEDDDTEKKRDIEDHLEEVRDYMENLEKDIDNKASRFRNWLQDLINRGLGGAEDRIKNIREIVKKIIAEAKEYSKKDLRVIFDYLFRHGMELKDFYEDLRNIIREELKKMQ